MDNPFDQVQQAMEDALYLEPEDLDANRMGRVTDRQKARIEGQLRSASFGMGCLSIMSLLPAVGIALLVEDMALRAIVIIGVIVWAYFFYRILRNVNSQRRVIMQDLKGGQAAAVSGTLKKREVSRRSSLYVGIDDNWFMVPRKVYDASPEGESVSIYYLPESRQFLSMESTG